MKKQIYLEAIRGLAALVVVFAHYAAAFYPSTLFGSKYQSHEDWETLFTTTPLGLVFAGQFAVCLFFILSGYVLSIPFFGESSKNTKHLLAAFIKRPFRLGGLVVASELISFCLLRFAGYFNVAVSRESYSIPWFQQYWSQGAISFKRLIFDLTTNMFSAGSTYNPPLWTLRIELYGSFITFIFLLLFRRSNLRVLAYIFAAVYFHGDFYQGFLLGILLADFVRNYPDALARCSRSIISWPFLGIGLVLSSYPSCVDPSGTFYAAFPRLPGLGGGYSMLGAVVVFVSLLLNRQLQQVLSKPLFAFLGRISYAVYAVHFLLLSSFSSWLFLTLRSRLSYNESFVIVGILSISVLVLLSHYISRYVDEPVIQAANRVAKLWLRSMGDNPSSQSKESEAVRLCIPSTNEA